MSDVFNIAKSGLNSAQIGIAVTGHNIANAATPGYSRQQAVQTSAGAQNFGFGYLGQGSQVADVKRLYNQVVAQQVNTAQTTSSATSAYSAQMQQIDNMLSDSTAGLSPSIQQFFSSVQSFASNPSSAATRQSVLSSAQMLVNRFESLGSRLDQIRTGADNQLKSSAVMVTSYAQQIAQINDTISRAVASTDSTPNDLMDQRDTLVTEMNKLIKTDVVTQADGSYNIFVGNGVPMVVGSTSYQLTTVKSIQDPTKLEIAYVSGNTTQLSASSLTGGSIGGLLQFRNESLDSIQNQIGQMAIVLADTFNTQHRAGFDSSGTAGGNVFNVPSPQSYGATTNNASATLSVSISNTAALTSSDYRIAYDGANYRVTRLSDNTVQSFTSLPQTVDGLSINGTLTAGDAFTIQPTRNAAISLSLAMTDISKLAAADATGGSANNKNALLLAGLQNQKTVNNGTLSYEGAFGQLVSGVGVKTNELKINGQAEETLLAQVVATQQSESGVNLDEEATNLLRYQQAYQAAGKLMQIASSLFDTLLSLGK